MKKIQDCIGKEFNVKYFPKSHIWKIEDVKNSVFISGYGLIDVVEYDIEEAQNYINNGYWIIL